MKLQSVFERILDGTFEPADIQKIVLESTHQSTGSSDHPETPQILI
jgi:hypothetical protein